MCRTLIVVARIMIILIFLLTFATFSHLSYVQRLTKFGKHVWSGCQCIMHDTYAIDILGGATAPPSKLQH